MSTDKNGKKKWKRALALLAASVITVACFGVFMYVALYKILPFFLPTDYVDEAYTYGDHIETGYVGFKAETIIEALDQNTTNPFFPLAGYAIWGRTWNYHRSFKWRSIDLNNVKITAEEAMKITESHGGLEIRSKAMNNCMITLTLSPDYSRSSGSSWSVIYLGGGKRIFCIFIDSRIQLVNATLQVRKRGKLE